MKLKITRRKDGSFDGSDGERVPYFWYKAVRPDGVTLEFGSKNDSYSEGDELELDIEKTERANGKFGYKEVA